MNYLILLFFGLYLFKLIQNRTNRKKNLDEAEEELFKNVRENLGENSLQNLKSKNFWVGMPEPLIYYVCGKPVEVQKRETANNIEKTWCYRPIPNARSNAREKYYLEIYTYNYVVTDWKKK